MDENRTRKLAGMALKEDVEQINEASKGFLLNDYFTKFAVAVLTDISKKLPKQRFTSSVRTINRENRSMAILEFKGYTKSDTEFSGSLYIIFDAPSGSGKNIINLELKGVSANGSDNIATFRNSEPVDTKSIAKIIDEKTTYMF